MRLAGRSPRELAFRLQQALANLRIWALPPRLPQDFSPGRLELSGLAPRDEVLSLANGILEHRWPLFDSQVNFGKNIEWRRDYIHGKVSGLEYFRTVPYLDFEKVGDHKNVWELNRHQHLVVLAEAFSFTGDSAYCKEIEAQLDSWWEQDPFLRGMNWASALEVAFRAISWLWVDELAGQALTNRRRLWNSLFQHGAFLECNLSTYFSPNTHLLGEAVALHAIGIKCKRADWQRTGAEIVRDQLQRQVAPDGSHFEQSTYYHVYALDMFLLHYMLEGRPEIYRPVLRKMAGFLASIAGPDRLLTCFGDDDGGRLFHPYGPRDEFARATLASCLELEPSAPATRLFPDSGLVSIIGDRTHVLVDAGPFGFGGAGHSHADTLSITARVGRREVLIDPGTFTYIADPDLRNRFRGTGFHNTIRIDGMDQADPSGPFRWRNKPEVQVAQWIADGELTFLDASCRYRGLEHRRRVLSVDDEWLFVLDEVLGAGIHEIEQFWHVGDADVRILVSDPDAGAWEEGLRSRVLGQKERAPVFRVSWKRALPHVCGAAIPLCARTNGCTLILSGEELAIPGLISVSFRSSGMPEVTRLG